MMKRNLKTLLVLLLIVCIPLTFCSCNSVLNFFGGYAGVNRRPCDFADSVWRTDDGSLTIYGTGNGQNATAVYTAKGKTSAYYIIFDEVGSAYIYDGTSNQLQNEKGGFDFDVWNIDYVNFDYHGFLEIEAQGDEMILKEFKSLFADKKPVKLRQIKGETIPEQQVIEETAQYRIFQNGLLFGYKIMNGKKVVLSGMSTKKPTIGSVNDNVIELQTTENGMQNRYYCKLKTNQVSMPYQFDGLFDVADDMLVYYNDDYPTSLSINKLFGYAEDYEELDFLTETDVVTDIQLLPEENAVEVFYQSQGSAEVKRQKVSYSLIEYSAETYAGGLDIMGGYLF